MDCTWLDYAEAHVRACTGRSCRDWTANEIALTFALLPAPAVPFDLWRDALRAPDASGSAAVAQSAARIQAMFPGVSVTSAPPAPKEPDRAT